MRKMRIMLATLSYVNKIRLSTITVNTATGPGCGEVINISLRDFAVVPLMPSGE